MKTIAKLILSGGSAEFSCDVLGHDITISGHTGSPYGFVAEKETTRD